jgi:hypothetical protein
MTKEELQGIFAEALAGPMAELNGRIDALEARVPAESTEDPATKEEGTDADLAGIKDALELIGTKMDELAAADESLGEVAEKVLDRVEALEKRSISRTSLEGQETDEDGKVVKVAPKLSDAIGAALKNPGQAVTIR